MFIAAQIPVKQIFCKDVGICMVGPKAKVCNQNVVMMVSCRKGDMQQSTIDREVKNILSVPLTLKI